MAPTEKAGNRHRARRREVVALGVRRRRADGEVAREQAHSQQGKRPRLAVSPEFRSGDSRQSSTRSRNIGVARAHHARAGGGNSTSRTCPGLAAHEAVQAVRAATRRPTSATRWSSRRPRSAYPDALLPVPEPDERAEAARSLAAQRDHMVACATRDKNRLRSVLLEPCPAFEALADLSDPHWLAMLERLGGAWGVRDAGKAALGAVTRGADRSKIDAAWDAAGSSTRPSEYAVAAENQQVRMLARRIREASEEASRLDSEITALLMGDGVHECLLTVPGIGPRTASELAVGIDIARFPDHHHLASYCGIAPRKPPLRHVHIIGLRVQAGEQEAEEPAHLLVQLAMPEQEPVRRVLQGMPQPRHVPRGGAEGRRPEADQGHLRDHAGRGPPTRPRKRTAPARKAPRPGACVSVSRNPESPQITD